MKSRCTHCDNRFTFEPKEDKIGEVTVSYSECDCGHRYLISATDKKIRAKLSKVRGYLKKYQSLKNSGDKAGSVKAWQTYQRNVKAVREQMKEAKGTYSSAVHEVIGGR